MYKNIIKKESKSAKKLKKDPIYQKRNNIQKDIFLIQNKERLHIKIFSEKSLLTIKEKHKKIIFNEQLENIKYLSQDDILFDKKNNLYRQTIRYCTSSSGTYTYPESYFLSPDMNIFLFDIPGKILPKDISSYIPYMKGFAKKISFSLQKKFNVFNAQHFKASLDPKKAF